jgi:hypothetical protein
MQLLLHKQNIKWLGNMERYVYNTGDFMVEFDFIATALLRQLQATLE